MADEDYDLNIRDSSEQNDPHNPPQSVLRPEARRAALMSYLGPVIVLFAVVGVALIYWVNRGPLTLDERGEPDAIGTAGTATPGGSNPDPDFGSTREELEYRGTDDGTRELGSVSDAPDPLTSLDAVQSGASAGRRVEIDNVAVVSVDGNTLWISDGTGRIAVRAPADTPAIESGSHVSVAGATELDERGGVRIRASRVKEK